MQLLFYIFLERITETVNSPVICHTFIRILFASNHYYWCSFFFSVCLLRVLNFFHFYIVQEVPLQSWTMGPPSVYLCTCYVYFSLIIDSDPGIFLWNSLGVKVGRSESLYSFSFELQWLLFVPKPYSYCSALEWTRIELWHFFFHLSNRQYSGLLLVWNRTVVTITLFLLSNFCYLLSWGVLPVALIVRYLVPASDTCIYTKIKLSLTHSREEPVYSNLSWWVSML